MTQAISMLCIKLHQLQDVFSFSVQLLYQKKKGTFEPLSIGDGTFSFVSFLITRIAIFYFSFFVSVSDIRSASGPRPLRPDQTLGASFVSFPNQRSD